MWKAAEDYEQWEMGEKTKREKLKVKRSVCKKVKISKTGKEIWKVCEEAQFWDEKKINITKEYTYN